MKHVSVPMPAVVTVAAVIAVLAVTLAATLGGREDSLQNQETSLQILEADAQILEQPADGTEPTAYGPGFSVPTIFEDGILGVSAVLGLHPVDPEDERFRGITGWCQGYTYFDFTGESRRYMGEGTFSKVVFSNGPNFTGGSDFAIGSDTKAYAEIDGEWQQAWFFSGELTLKAVMPVLLWGDFFGDGFRFMPALLVVGTGDFDSVRFITVLDGTLHVLQANLEDSLQVWYRQWPAAVGK